MYLIEGGHLHPRFNQVKDPAAIEIVTNVAAVAGSFAIGAYLGAALVCTAKIVANQLSLQAELASAEPGFAKQQVENELQTIEQNSVRV